MATEPKVHKTVYLGLLSSAGCFLIALSVFSIGAAGGHLDPFNIGAGLLGTVAHSIARVFS